MDSSDPLLTLIYDAIDEVNQLLPEEQQIRKEPSAVLVGAESSLDSFGLVNLIVAVEERAQDTLAVTVTLADEKAMSRSRSPFRTVATLRDHLAAAVEEARHG